MFTTFRTTSFIVISCLLVTSCGGGGGGKKAAPDPVINQAIGGAWVGMDGNGDEVLALSTESGELHWVIPATGEQGFGTGTVNGSSISISYTYVAPLGFTLADGSTSATCTATGTIQERQSLTLNTSCTTSLGATFNNSVSLSYDPLYELDSDLSVVAGNYDDFGQVINVAANGVIFEQDANTGCVINGQVSIDESRYNAYSVSFTYMSCQGEYAVLNGATFSGLAIYDNTTTPHQITLGLTGDVLNVTYSLVITIPKL